MHYRQTGRGLPFLIVIGCAQATTSSPRVPETARIPTPVSTPASGVIQSWIFKPATTPQTYTSVSNITLELTSSSGVSRDSMIVTSRYSLELDPQDESTSISGQVDQYSITAGSKIGPASPLQAPLTFAGTVTSDQILIQPVEPAQRTSVSSNCPDFSLTILSGIRRGLLTLPPRISSGMTWPDSTTSTICHGSTPVILTLSNTYRVINEVNRRGIPAILIERVGKSSSTGDGSDGQHRVAIAGDGATTSRLYIDKDSGLLIEAENDQEMRLTITSSGRSQKFTQTVREIIALANR